MLGVYERKESKAIELENISEAPEIMQELRSLQSQYFISISAIRPILSF